MTWIQVGRFDDFGGSDTLLFECDPDGLQALINVVRGVEVHGEPSPLVPGSGIVVHGGITVTFEQSREDVGLVAIEDRDYIWRLSSEGWAEVVEKLAVMQRAHDGHQYFEGADDLTIMVAIGEYGDEWWARHAPGSK